MSTFAEVYMKEYLESRKRIDELSELLNTKDAEIMVLTDIIAALREQVAGLNSICEMHEKTVEVLTAHASQLQEQVRWVPVSESLPDDGVPVLVWPNAEYRINEAVIATRYGEDHWSYAVTHWMPLPPPPLQEQEK